MNQRELLETAKDDLNSLLQHRVFYTVIGSQVRAWREWKGYSFALRDLAARKSMVQQSEVVR